jgi:hypothetical protein
VLSSYIYLTISANVISVQQGIPFLRTVVLRPFHKGDLPVVEYNQGLEKICLAVGSISRQIYHRGISLLDDSQNALCRLRDGEEAALFLHITAGRSRYVSYCLTIVLYAG